MASISENISCAIAICVIMILNSSCSSFSLPTPTIKTTHETPDHLDDYLYNLSFKSIPKWPHSNVIYKISLQANFSGMEVSVLKLRSNTLWTKGANFSSFDIPPRTITLPYVKRVALMYENLGNLSSHFYELPGFKFVTPVVGLVMYNASDLSRRSSPKRLNITLMGEPIEVRFAQVDHTFKERNATLMQCITFEPVSGSAELTKMESQGVCLTKSLGHFAIAVPVADSSPLSLSPSLSPPRRGRGETRAWRWSVIGVLVGLFGLILAASISILGYRAFASRKIRIMESKSEKSETLDTRWIGNSKLPSASMTRTQAVTLESDSAP